MFRLKIFLRRLLGDRVWLYIRRWSPLPRHVLIRICQVRTGNIVQYGPFKGMRYLDDTISGGYIPKLLGIYEKELHPVINRIPQYGFEKVINIGAADGYYSVGLARMIPNLHIISFEMEKHGQDLILKMAHINGVHKQIEIRGVCTIEKLAGVLKKKQTSLIICDVEGYEDILLDPGLISELREAFILVELHDCKVAGVTDRIRERFLETHNIETIWQQKRTEIDFPIETEYTRKIAQKHLSSAVNEGRPVSEDGSFRMSWFWMTPKT